MKRPNKDKSFIKTCEVIRSCKTTEQLKVAARMASRYISFCMGTVAETRKLISLLESMNQVIHQEYRLKRKVAHIKRVSESNLLRTHNAA